MLRLSIRLFYVPLIAVLSGCMPMMPGMPGMMGAGMMGGAMPNPIGTINPAGALMGASTDCAGMAMVLADPAQPVILKDQVQQAMAAGGCV